MGQSYHQVQLPPAWGPDGHISREAIANPKPAQKNLVSYPADRAREQESTLDVADRREPTVITAGAGRRPLVDRRVTAGVVGGPSDERGSHQKC
jgi:hypothetical protein